MTNNDGSDAGGAVPGPPEPARVRLQRWARQRLGWSRLYRATSYMRSALWGVPILAVVLERITYRLLHSVDRWITWDLTGLDADGARARGREGNASRGAGR